MKNLAQTSLGEIGIMRGVPLWKNTVPWDRREIFLSNSRGVDAKGVVAATLLGRITLAVEGARVLGSTTVNVVAGVAAPAL